MPGSITTFGSFRLETSTMGLEMGMPSVSLTMDIMPCPNSSSKWCLNTSRLSGVRGRWSFEIASGFRWI